MSCIFIFLNSCSSSNWICILIHFLSELQFNWFEKFGQNCGSIFRMSQQPTNCCSDSRPIGGAANEGGSAPEQKSSKRKQASKSHKSSKRPSIALLAIINLWANKVLAVPQHFLATRQHFWIMGNFFGHGGQHFQTSYSDPSGYVAQQKFVILQSSLLWWEQMTKRTKKETGEWVWKIMDNKCEEKSETYRHIRSVQAPPCWTVATCRLGSPQLCLEIILWMGPKFNLKCSYQGYVLEGSVHVLHDLWSAHSRLGLFQK